MVEGNRRKIGEEGKGQDKWGMEVSEVQMEGEERWDRMEEEGAVTNISLKGGVEEGISGVKGEWISCPTSQTENESEGSVWVNCTYSTRCGIAELYK